MSTNNIPNSDSLTFEKVWQLIQETSKELRELFKETDRRMQERMQETDRRMQEQMQETDRRMQETDKQMKETDRRMQETDKQMKETDRRMQETDRLIQENSKLHQKNEELIEKLSKQFGNLGQSFGELAEHLVSPGIVRIFNELGHHFYEVSSNIEIKDDNNRTLTEIDLLLDNDETIVVVEVKTKPREGDIPHHLTRLNILREHIKRHKKPDKKIIGAIAGAVFDKEVKANAIAAGLYTITQSGDTLKIDVPEDFKPQIF
jgi:hypothetical protein